MNRLFAFLTLTTMAFCNDKKENKVEDLKTQIVGVSPFDRNKLDNYFAEYEIKPAFKITNTEGILTEMQISTHKIKWLNTDSQTKIKIDSDIFSLKDKVTTNVVWDNVDSVDFANNWSEINLYKINNRELICIKMTYQPCTGIGCSVDYYLIYDCQTKTKNFFGTFRTDNKLALYNFNNDNKLDYLSKTFHGDAQGSTTMTFIYELYSLESNGQFVLQTNNIGQAYQIRCITYPNDTTKTETIEQRWFTKIE